MPKPEFTREEANLLCMALDWWIEHQFMNQVPDEDEVKVWDELYAKVASYA